MDEHLSVNQKVSVQIRQMQPKSVRLQERKSTYCSAIWTLIKAASQYKRKYRVSATPGDGSLRIPQGRMCPKEIYNVLMQEFAGFCKTSVDVRYWLIPSVNTGANAGRCGWNRSSSQAVHMIGSTSERSNLTVGMQIRWSKRSVKPWPREVNIVSASLTPPTTVLQG